MDNAILKVRPVQGTSPGAHQEPPQELSGSPPREKVRAFNLHRLVYRGQRGQIFRIAIVNSLLSLLTLGLYRFWARTRLRCYFWSHVELDGDPIEYTGTGRQLFIGFLIVMAVLLPLLFGLDYAANLFPQDAWQRGVFGLVQVLGLLFLIQYAVFRARRYRLGHTRWRGIRASQTGSALTYAMRAFGYLMLTFLTLGLSYPLYRVKTQSYLTKNTLLGSQPFAFRGRARALFGAWMAVWLTSLLAFGAATLGMGLAVNVGTADGFIGPVMNVSGQGSTVLIANVFVLSLFLLLFVWYRTREFRYFADVTSFGSLRFASALKARGILRIYALYYLVFALVFVAIAALLQAVFGGLDSPLFNDLEAQSLQELLVQMHLIKLALYVVAALIAAMLVGTLQPVLIGHPLLKKVVASIRFRGRYDVEGLLQGAKAAERRGEGLADAFDVELAGF